MYRADLLNFLIQQRKAKRYLEIGIHDERNTLAHIRCAYKGTTYPSSSEDYFSRNKELFDVVFIDGVHTEEETQKDIKYALSSLAAGGVVVVHDCLPPDAWHQREPEDYKEGENWNGLTWKAVLRIFNESTFKCTIADMDWGCGIIDTTQTQMPKHLPLPETLSYDAHFNLLLDYKSRVAAHLREAVKLFYHLACMGNWREVFQEQMLSCKQNDFLQLSMTILGTPEDLQAAKKMCETLQLNVQIIFESETLGHFEQPAMLAIEDYAKNNEGYILYLHSKGVSNPTDNTKTKWRRLMMRELVEHWEHCMLQLPAFDAIGVNWRDMPPTSHFCGNFWYASTSYLRKLSDFRHYYQNPRYQICDSINSKRLGCEFWISSGRETPKVLSLFCRNQDFCNAAYWIGK